MKKNPKATIKDDGYEVHYGFRIRKLNTKAGIRYQVDLGRKSGKHVRKTFEALNGSNGARKWAHQERLKRDRQGLQASNFTDEQREDAIQALATLKPYGANLRAAANFYVKKNQPVTDENRFSTLVDQYIKQMEKRKFRPRTIADAKTRLQRFVDAWGDLAIETIDTDDISNLMDSYGYSATNRDNYIRRLEAFFNWAVKKEKAKSKPAMPIDDDPLEDEKTPQIYKPSQVLAVLRMAEQGSETKKQKARPELVPYFAIAFFAGVRPKEIARLKWNDIDLAARIIIIKGSQAKTRRARNVPISDNLMLWLAKYHPSKNGNTPVLGVSSASLARWRPNLMNTANVEMIQDGARHSFATYFFALHGLSETMEAMGHLDPETLKHYKGLSENRKAQAKKYFEIAPVEHKGVIKFPQSQVA